MPLTLNADSRVYAVVTLSNEPYIQICGIHCVPPLSSIYGGLLYLSGGPKCLLPSQSESVVPPSTLPAPKSGSLATESKVLWRQSKLTWF